MKTSYWLKPFASLIREHQKRKAIKDLQTLPHYLLTDIGIERETIPTIVIGMMNTKHTQEATVNLPASNEKTISTRDLLLSRA